MIDDSAMNVRELIDELEQYPDDTEVRYLYFDHPHRVVDIDVSDGSNCVPPRDEEILVIR